MYKNRFFIIFGTTLWLLAGCEVSDYSAVERDTGVEPDTGNPTTNESCASLQCADHLVCDEATLTCRPPLFCAAAACVRHQLCEDAQDGFDAVCLPECEPGFNWSNAQSYCVPTPADCDPSSANNIVDACLYQHRTCVEHDDETASCGRCMQGYVLADGQCVAIKNCTDLQCADLNRDCKAATDSEHAECLACEEGALENDKGACIRQSCTRDANEGSLLSVCEAMFRVCETIDEGAVCSACMNGYVEDDNGDCVERTTCATLNCADQARQCSENVNGNAVCGPCFPGFFEIHGNCIAIPNANCNASSENGSVLEACDALHRTCEDGQCTACVAGYHENADTQSCEPDPSCAQCFGRNQTCVEKDGRTSCGRCLDRYVLSAQTGHCRPVKSCDEVDCATGDVCVDAEDDRDAHCRTDCGTGSIFNGYNCAPCPRCDGVGEAGVASRTTSTGTCICRTLPGYFYSRSADVGTYPCDKDEDGWVRSSARTELESGDPVLMENARCAVRTIDRVLLENEYGHTKEIVLQKPVALFESDRNDDDRLLQVHWERFNIPKVAFVSSSNYCDDTQLCANNDETCVDNRCVNEGIYPARTLNGLTKACHSMVADFNDNGFLDVDEWGEKPSAIASSDRKVLNRFNYFMELYDGRFVADIDDETGYYHIRERKRNWTPGDDGAPLGITYDSRQSDHWKQCIVKADSRAATVAEPVGMDFSEYAPHDAAYFNFAQDEQWWGMNHHSQFKCIQVTAQANDAAVQKVSAAYIAAGGLDLNTCKAQLDGDGAVQYACETETRPPDVDAVLWGAVNYQTYNNYDNYGYGCVNECAEARKAQETMVDSANWKCPTVPGNPLVCTDRKDAFGTLECVEACGDGIDNDADGIIDEFDGKGEVCDTGRFGKCATGIMTCVNYAPTCVPDFYPMVDDNCNGIDEDCDGEIDEHFEIGADCSNTDYLKNSDCFAGKITGCNNGVETCESVIKPGTNAERCDGRDNNCDGLVDGGVNVLPSSDPKIGQDCNSDPSSNQNGVCAGTWTTVCREGQVTCTSAVWDDAHTKEEKKASPNTPNLEVCNNLDDNCDGEVDENDVCVGTIDFTMPFQDTVLEEGDQEFSGHGPKVTLTFKSQVVDNNRIRVSITGHFRETKSNWTTGTFSWTKTISTAVTNKTAEYSIRITSDTNGTISYIDTDHAEDNPEHENGTNIAEWLPDRSVHFRCIGDTKGNDVGEGTGCRGWGTLTYEVIPK